MENRPTPRRRPSEAERPAKPYDPLTGKFLDGPHPDEPDNNEGEGAPAEDADSKKEPD